MNPINPLLQTLMARDGTPPDAPTSVGEGLTALFGRLLAAAQEQVAQASEVVVPGDGLVDGAESAVLAGESALLDAVTEGETEAPPTVPSEADDAVPRTPAAQAATQNAAGALAAVASAQAQPSGVPVAQTAVNQAPTPPASGSVPGAEVDNPSGTTVPLSAVPAPVAAAGAAATGSATGPGTLLAAFPATALAGNPAAGIRTRVSADTEVPQTAIATVAVPASDEGEIPLRLTGTEDGVVGRLAGSGTRPSTLAALVEELMGAASAQTTLADAAPGSEPADPALDAARIRPELQGRVPTQSGEIRPAPGSARPDGLAQHALPDPPEIVHVRDVGDAAIRSIRYLSGRTEETITVRLVPQSLGEMQIAVRSSAEGMDVVLTTATVGAREAVEQQLAGLRDALARDGIDVVRVTVQTGTSNEPNAQGAGNASGGRSEEFGEQPVTRFAALNNHDGALDMRA